MVKQNDSFITDEMLVKYYELNKKKKEIEFRTTNNEIFNYETIIYILRGYGKYFRGGRNVFAYIDNKYTPNKTYKRSKNW